MNTLDSFEVVGRRGIYRPPASDSLEAGVEKVTAAITFARKAGLFELLLDLVDVCSLKGLKSPTTLERYNFMTKWASAAGGALRIAMVLRPEMMDPQNIGVTIARNRGLTCDVFTSEADAVAWLDTFTPRS